MKTHALPVPREPGPATGICRASRQLPGSPRRRLRQLATLRRAPPAPSPARWTFARRDPHTAQRQPGPARSAIGPICTDRIMSASFAADQWRHPPPASSWQPRERSGRPRKRPSADHRQPQHIPRPPRKPPPLIGSREPGLRSQVDDGRRASADLAGTAAACKPPGASTRPFGRDPVPQATSPRPQPVAHLRPGSLPSRNRLNAPR